MTAGTALNIADIVSCCFPKPNTTAQTTIFGLVTVYGFAEDKRWAKWAGLIGLGVTALHMVRCVRQRIADASPPQVRQGLPAAPAVAPVQDAEVIPGTAN